MGNWNLPSFIRWSRSRLKKRKGAVVSSGTATSSAARSEDPGLCGTRYCNAKNRMRSLISRTLQSTRTFFRIGRRAPPVSEHPPEESRNATAIFTISHDNTDDSSYVQRNLYDSSYVNSTETELNTERTFADLETTLELSPAPQTLDSTKLPEIARNSRASIFSVGKSKVWSKVRNESATPSAPMSTPNSNLLSSNSTKRKSKLNFSQSPIRTPVSAYSNVHSSTLTPAMGASSASSWTAAGNDFSFSPISLDQSLRAHTSVNFKFNREHQESNDWLNSVTPVDSSTQALNPTAEKITVNDDRQTSYAMTSVGDRHRICDGTQIESSVSHLRNISAEYLDTDSRRISSTPHNSRPDVFCSQHSSTLEVLCKSQYQTAEETSNLPSSRNGERLPALPPKLYKFRSSFTPMQFSKAVIDYVYVQPSRPISLPTVARTLQQGNETLFTPDDDYSEIIELSVVRSPSRLSPWQPDSSSTGHPILDVPRTPVHSSPPPPLPPRCPRVALRLDMPQRSGNTGVTSLVVCPPPLPPRVPSIRLSEAVDVATRLTLRGIAAFALASSLEDISQHEHPTSATVATQTTPEGRTVATQTLPLTSTSQTSALTTTDVCPTALEVTVIHPKVLNEPETYLSMKGARNSRPNI